MRALIIGGGIAGLTAAYQLQMRGVDYILLERAETCGGKIITTRADDFVIEGRPDAFLTTKPAALELCRALGLDAELIPTNPAQRKTYVWRRGALRQIPDGSQLIAPTKFKPFAQSSLLSWRAKARMGLEYFIPARASNGDESVASFVQRRMGREALEVLAEPLLTGIYVADPNEQSLASTFPRFRDMEEKHGGILRVVRAQRALGTNDNGATRSMFMSLRGGMAQLSETLSARLDARALWTKRRVISISRHAEKYRAHLDDGARVEADALICATPAAITSEILRDLDAELAAQIGQLRAVSSASVSLGYARRAVPHALDGYGFVVPRCEGQNILGCTWASVKFAQRAPDGFALLRVFIGSAHKETLAESDDATLIHTARAALRTMLGITAASRVTRVFQWRKANPQYDVGHAARNGIPIYFYAAAVITASASLIALRVGRAANEILARVS